MQKSHSLLLEKAYVPKKRRRHYRISAISVLVLLTFSLGFLLTTVSLEVSSAFKQNNNDVAEKAARTYLENENVICLENKYCFLQVFWSGGISLEVPFARWNIGLETNLLTIEVIPGFSNCPSYLKNSIIDQTIILYVVKEGVCPFPRQVAEIENRLVHLEKNWIDEFIIYDVINQKYISQNANIFRTDDTAEFIIRDRVLGYLSESFQFNQTFAASKHHIKINFTPKNQIFPTFDEKELEFFEVANAPSDSLTKNPASTRNPSLSPTLHPRVLPTLAPTLQQTQQPSYEPTLQLTQRPTPDPTLQPVQFATDKPSQAATESPTREPVQQPTLSPTQRPTVFPTRKHTERPVVIPPTISPTTRPISSSFEDKFKGSKPNILTIMVDDAGYGDVGFGHINGFREPRKKVKQATAFLTKLVQEESLRLTRHYGHWHCSPSRRSFITGRLSIHTGEQLSRQLDHDLDLRYQWISEKLKLVNYSNYFIGKGHLGYKSVYHLPTLRGFDDFNGILTGQTDYYNFNHWVGCSGNHSEQKTYATEYYGDQVRKILTHHERQDENQPFFLFWSMQAPHTPIMPPAIDHYKYGDFSKKKQHPYEYMLYAADVEIKETIELMKAKGLWENTLVVFLSDNGATQQNLWTKHPYTDWETKGSNYPFRGEKKSSFEGAFRVPAFISGGIVPKSLHGKDSGIISHISDWYATFCFLAGIDPTEPDDEQQISAKTLIEEVISQYEEGNIDARRPSLNNKNLWGERYPQADSLNLAEYLLDEDSFVQDREHHHKDRNDLLMLSTEAMIYKNYKFIAAQACSFYINTTTCNIDQSRFGWIKPNAKTIVGSMKKLGCLKVNHPLDNEMHYEPCIFDLETDIREEQAILDDNLVEELFDKFNQSLLTQYTDLLIGKENGLTPISLPTADSVELSADLEKVQIEFFGVTDSPIEHLNRCKVDHPSSLQCMPLL